MRLQSLGERPPFGGRQHHPEMRHGDVMPVDRIMRGPATWRIDAVRDDLMPVKVEVDPVGGAASFRSDEHTSKLQSLMRTSYAAFCLHQTTKPYSPQIIEKIH